MSLRPGSGPKTSLKTQSEIFRWAILSLIMVLVVLFFGLNVKEGGITNDVQWLPHERLIRFQNSGIAYVNDLRVIRLRRQPGPLTIEMAVTPGSVQRQGFSPLLVMHDGADQRQIAIWQWGPSLIVMNGDDYDNSRRRPRVTDRNFLMYRRTCYLTITSAEQGTRVFVNGVQTAANRKWRLTFPIQGDVLRLVLGNSVDGKHGWTGDIHGLAIFGEAISAEKVRQRYEQWIVDHNFDFLQQESPLLLFNFNQKSGIRFADQSGNQQDLEIPPHMIALKRTILASPWPHLNWSRAMVGDMVVNTLGFMPLGIVLYGLLACFPGVFGRNDKFVAVSLCMLLSLGIELAQAWIPTRYSTLLDLLLNTFGAWLGIGLWKMVVGKKI